MEITFESVSNSNLAVYGASGSMKTRSFCMNRILQGVSRGESLVICDPKSELYEKSSEYLRNKGYTVRVFNLVNPENSDSWNCLSEVEGQELMVQLFVNVIIKNTTGGGKGDHFWDSAEMNLLKALVLSETGSTAAKTRRTTRRKKEEPSAETDGDAQKAETETLSGMGAVPDSVPDPLAADSDTDKSGLADDTAEKAEETHYIYIK